MRDLKFRIWDNLLKTFSYFDITLSSYMIPIDLRGNIQQYTGCKDAKGVLIYEGDIVCETITQEMAAAGTSAYIAQILFAAGTFFIDGEGPLYDRTDSHTPDRLEDYTVIGNIFENPELIHTIS